MTYKKLCTLLKDGGVDAPEWEAALLMEHFYGISPSLCPLSPNEEYPDGDILNAVRRRLDHEPLQYILGEWSFYRQTYKVTPDCLIPRSDTEILVEEAIGNLPKNALFADLCTGSGCIAVSVLAERQDLRCIAVDKFPATLALAAHNAGKNGVLDRFTPMQADVLSPFPLCEYGSLDAILSNPPYINTDVVKGLAPELHREPLAALDGGADGLDFYRAILRHTAVFLKEEGFFLFEIGYDQADALERLGKEAGFPHCKIRRDYGGNERTVTLSRHPV